MRSTLRRKPKARDVDLRSKSEAARARRTPERRDPEAQRRGRMMGASGFGYFGQDQSNPP